MTWKRCQVASTPAEAATRSRSVSSELDATAQRVCGTTRTRCTLSRCTPSTIASSAASVTRPPGLRKILASPGPSPSIPSGSMRESMHVTMATPARATPSKPPYLKSAANSRFAARRSSKLSTSGDTSAGSAGGAEQVAGRDRPGLCGPEEPERQHACDRGADGGTDEDGLLLGDA